MDFLLGQEDKSVTLEERASGDAGFSKDSRQVQTSGLLLDLPQQLLANSLTLMIGVNVEAVKVTVQFEVGKTGNLAETFSDNRKSRLELLFPKAEINGTGRPCSDLAGGVVAAVDPLNGVTEQCKQLG